MVIQKDPPQKKPPIWWVNSFLIYKSSIEELNCNKYFLLNVFQQLGSNKKKIVTIFL